MRNIIILFCIFLSGLFKAYCQKEVRTFMPKDLPSNGLSFAGSNDSYCLFYNVWDQNHKFIFMNDAGLLKENDVRIPAGFEWDWLENDSAFVLLFYDFQKNSPFRYYYVYVNKQTGIASASIVSSMNVDHSQAFFAFAKSDSSFYALSVWEKTNKMEIYTLVPGKPAIQKTFYADTILNSKLLTRNTVLNFSPHDYNSLYKSSSWGKVYSEKNTIILSFDESDKEHSTLFYTIPLDKDSIHYRWFSDEINPGMMSNSFFLNDRLYRFSVANQVITLSEYNTISGELIKKYQNHVGDSLEIIKSPFTIWEPKNYWTGKDSTAYTVNRSLRYLLGMPSIYATDGDSAITLYLGTYKENVGESVNGGALAGALLGGLVGAAIGYMIVPTTSNGTALIDPKTYADHYNNYIPGPGTSSFFKTTLTSAGILRERMVNKTDLEKAQLFEEELNKNSGKKISARWVTHSGKDYKAVYIDKKGTIHIVSFD